MAKLTAVVSLLLVSSFCLAHGEPQQQDEAFIDDRDAPHEPFISEKAELFRYSRSPKGGLLANMARYNEQQKQHQQQQQLVSNDLVEVSQQPQMEQQVAMQMPNFGSSSSTSGTSDGSSEQTADFQQPQVQQPSEQPQPPSHSSSSSSSSSHSTKTQDSDSHSRPQPHHTYTHTRTQTHHNPKTYRVVKTVTTTTTTHFNGNGNGNGNQGAEPRVARLQEVRVHTVPLSEAVHYANYVVVPAGPNGKAARLEEASSSASSSKQTSSSSREETSSEVVAGAPAPTTTLVLPAQSPPAIVSPDCQVLHRLIVERPVSSQLVVKVPSEMSVSQSSSSSSLQSSRVVELAAPEPVLYTQTTVRRLAQPVLAARLVAAPAPAAVLAEPVANDGHLKEEHFHSESRSSREESHGGPMGSLSSSSSSSSSRSSKSSSSTTTTTTTQVAAQPAAALVAAPVPVVRQVTLVQRQPVVAVKAAPLMAVGGAKQATNSYSVDVDHHYTGPNVKYGYSIKQQSQEPVVQQQEAKGVVVGDRVVYL